MLQMAERPELQRRRLDLIAPGPVIASSTITALTTADWECLLRMVRQHRLGPLLHWQLHKRRRALPIPQAVREELAASFKRSTWHALGGPNRSIGRNWHWILRQPNPLWIPRRC
jgi:hypothetical protein